MKPNERLEALKSRAQGRWTDILRALGVEERILKRRNLPCPQCGGTDRFQYTDKFGNGDTHCRGCGHGDGFNLLIHTHGWDFATAYRRVEEIVGAVPEVAPGSPAVHSPERMKKLAQRLWEQAQPVAAGDAVDRYLRQRGLRMDDYPGALRCHPHLGYFEKDAGGRSKKVGEYAAMLAWVTGPDGRAVTLHRTYLQDGQKALGRESKKVLSAGIAGAAVRLFDPADELGVTEGIENALAVWLATGKPVWAALSAGNLEKLWLPESVRRVRVYADNDAAGEYDGQAAAFALARRLMKEGRSGTRRRVEVFVPKAPGADWADVWLHRRSSAHRAA